MAGYQKGKLSTEAGRPKHCLNNIHVLKRKTETIKQQGAGAGATLYCY